MTKIPMSVDVKYARDERGEFLERRVQVPFRPEFIHFISPGGDPSWFAAPMPWKHPEPIGVNEFVEPSGELAGDEPPSLKSFLFALDLRVCARYGIEFLDVVRVELPVLDYARGDDLVMGVFVRVRKGQEVQSMLTTRTVVKRARDPISGGWLVTLNCGHEITMDDQGGGIPVGARCPSCEAHDTFVKHARTCPLGCGLDYTRGRCAEGDRLADAMDAAGPPPIKLMCCFVGCAQEAKWWIGKTDYDATHSCADHVEELKGVGDTVVTLVSDGRVP